mgnify:FL=1
MRTRANKSVSRTDRLNAEFKKEIYEIISRRLKNPLVTEMFSILRVDCTKDLSHAKVYVSVFSTSDEKRAATFNAIKADAKKIRQELSRSMHIRTVPELDFLLDDSMEYSAKMDKIFSELTYGEHTEEEAEDGNADDGESNGGEQI